MENFLQTIAGKIAILVSSVALLFSGALAHNNQQPKTQTAAAVVATQEVSQASSSSQETVVNNYVTQPVIERTVQSGAVLGASTNAEQVNTAGGYVTQAELASQLSNLQNTFGKAIYGTTYPAPATSYGSGGVWNAIAGTNKIDQLSGTSLSNITVHGVSGLTSSDIPTDITASNYLPLAGGTIAGDLTVSGSFNAPSMAVGTLGGDVVIGDVANPSNLVFQENSTIKGAGSGRTLTFGANSDTINFAVEPNFTVGASSTVLYLPQTTDASTGVIYLASTRFIHNYASSASNGFNTFVGLGAGNFTLGPNGGASYLGSSNTALGYSALQSLTTGYNNIAIGPNAMLNNTTGFNNTAVGLGALQNVTTTGSSNTAVGIDALQYNTAPTKSVAIGDNAGVGNFINYSNSGSTIVGYRVGFKFQTGSDYNTFLGHQAGYGVTTGSNNLILGAATSSTAIANLTTGSQNILIGNNISLPSATASGQLDIGNILYGTGITGTGSTISSGNIGIGTTNPLSTLDINGGLAVGSYAGANAAPLNGAIISGNVGIGTVGPAHALDVYGDCIAYMGSCINTTAPSNVVSYTAGSFFFSSNTTQAINTTRYLGAANTAPATTDIAGYVVPSAGTISAMYVAADANSFTSSVSTVTLMKNTVATAMTCNLAAAGLTCSDIADPVTVVAGDRLSIRVVTTNSGSGSLTRSNVSLRFTTTTNVFSSQWTTNGSNISFAGGTVGVGTTTPWAALSIAALSSNTVPLFTISTTTSGNATSTAFIIDKNGLVGIGTSSPTTALQINGPITPNVDNTFTSGNSTYRWSAVYAANGTIQTSDVRLKDNIATTTYGLDQLMQLRPVSFTWKAQPEQGTKLGFIAQEVQPILPETVSVGDDANHTLGLTYTEFVPVIVKAIQQIATITGEFRNALIAWLGDVTNGIGDLFANNLHAKNELCVGDTCVTETQFKAMVAAANQTASSNSNNNSVPTDTSSASTPPIIEVTGNNPATVNIGDTYSDLGAKITGPTADLNLGIHTFVGTTPIEQAVIDTSAPATYHLYYVATDQNGLTSTSTRTVIVQAAPQSGAASDASSTLETATNIGDEATTTP